MSEAPEPRPGFSIQGLSPGGSGSGGPSGLPPWAAAVVAEAREWARERSWEVRAPVLAYLVWVWFNHLRALEYSSLFKGLNLGFHEAGHVVFRPLGEFMTIAGGTILQCLIPVIAAVLLYRQQRDFFGVAFCLGWLSTNFFDCGTYAADARGKLNLPLVSFAGQSFGADGTGDWSRMLGRIGKLHWDDGISTCFRLLGSGSMLLALALGGWLCWEIARSRRS